MQTTTVFLVLVALCIASFFAGRKRSQAVATGTVALHSLPKHYGYMAAAWAAIPGLFLLLLWLGSESSLLYSLVVQSMPDAVRNMPIDELGLYYNQVKSLAIGAIDASFLNDEQIAAAEHYQSAAASFARSSFALCQ